MNELNNCTRKRQYTEAAAKRAAATLRRRKRFGPGLAAYPCSLGGVRHWHVGKGRRR